MKIFIFIAISLVISPSSVFADPPFPYSECEKIAYAASKFSKAIIDGKTNREKVVQMAKLEPDYFIDARYPKYKEAAVEYFIAILDRLLELNLLEQKQRYDYVYRPCFTELKADQFKYTITRPLD